MKRDLQQLSRREFDLLIVGGGIYGVCAAWDAALRGLSVALLERSDFSAGTSANPYKVVHGGIRYLQHLDFSRGRQSSRERNTLLRIAPHLVRPLPIVVPTYRGVRKGRSLLAAGALLYDLVTLDRNRGIQDSVLRIPGARVLPRTKVCELFPKLSANAVTGGLAFVDGQIYSPPRLALAFLKSAVGAGAVAVNYVEVRNFLVTNGRVQGVIATDRLSGREVRAEAKVVLNAAGPWVADLLHSGLGVELRPEPSFSRDLCLVMKRRWSSDYGLAVPTRTQDPDAVLSRGARHLFAVPWRDHTLIGVWHRVHTKGPDDISATGAELTRFLEEMNTAIPGSNFRIEEIGMVNAGLVLFGDNDPGARNLSYGKRSLLIDHRARDGNAGLVSLIGVRYTTARNDASKAVDLILEMLGRRGPRCQTHTKPIHGGDIESVGELRRNAADSWRGVSPASLDALICNHGSQYQEVLSLIAEDPALERQLGASNVIAAEIVHAVRSEMAVKLSDAVERRTDLANARHPGKAALLEAAQLMKRELRWSPERTQREVDEVLGSLQSRTFAPTGARRQLDLGS